MAGDGQTDTHTHTQTWPRLCQPFQSLYDFKTKTGTESDSLASPPISPNPPPPFTVLLYIE